MTSTLSSTRTGTYYDSVVLMQLQRALLGLPGVEDAGVVMATPANCELLAANSLLPQSIAASADDLLIVVKAVSEESAANAIGKVDELLVRRRAGVTAHDFRPHSLEAAIQQLPQSKWALISVPGRYAAAVAHQALALRQHVFLYSDNVSLEDELSLKKTGSAQGLLVMGPDCGTAIVNGVGLGFANRVRRGSIGLIGASGTGLQAITSHIHNLGGGISHAIGTGGRDLRSEVGAITARQALDLLARDPQSSVIVMVSKPPSPDVATLLLSAAQMTGKPVIIYFLGYPPPARQLGNLLFAVSSAEAAEMAVGQLSTARPQALERSMTGYLRGLFSGGTLAYETLLGLRGTLSPLYSNAPVGDVQRLPDPLHSQAHTVVDLGDESFMVGRLHPMIDNDLRIRRLRQEAADPEVALILLDVVLGEGSHANPARELALAIKEIGRLGLEVVAIVVGTDEDPQNVESQVRQLKEAGVVVFRTVAQAVNYINSKYARRSQAALPRVDLDGLTSPVHAINVGLESFYESLVAQGTAAVHVDWRPPAGGNEKMAALLSRMKKGSGTGA